MAINKDGRVIAGRPVAVFVRTLDRNTNYKIGAVHRNSRDGFEDSVDGNHTTVRGRLVAVWIALIRPFVSPHSMPLGNGSTITFAW